MRKDLSSLYNNSNNSNSNNNNNNNNNNKLQLCCHPVAVVILHVHKYGGKKSN